MATGSESRDPAEVEGCLSQVEERLGADRVDLFFAEYVHPGDDVERLLDDDGVVGLLRRWKAEGRIRCVGATAHDRPLAKRLVDSGRIDVLMHRYNMAPPGGGGGRPARGPGPAWSPSSPSPAPAGASCPRATPGGRGRSPSAADCYRFALRHEAVQTGAHGAGGPGGAAGPISPPCGPPEATEAEMAAWRAYGDVVHGSGRDEFETRWP